MECCDSDTEEICYDYDDGYNKPFTNQYCAAIAGGGCPCPDDQVKCGQGKIILFLVANEQVINFISLILMFLITCSLSDLDNDYAGYCTDVCCDQKTEETCYNYDYETGTSNTTCAPIANGGCPCQENQVKCGQGKILLFFVVLQMKIVD
jgi:hypothetical protein